MILQKLTQGVRRFEISHPDGATALLGPAQVLHVAEIGQAGKADLKHPQPVRGRDRFRIGRRHRLHVAIPRLRRHARERRREDLLRALRAALALAQLGGALACRRGCRRMTGVLQFLGDGIDLRRSCSLATARFTAAATWAGSIGGSCFFLISVLRFVFRRLAARAELSAALATMRANRIANANRGIMLPLLPEPMDSGARIPLPSPCRA